MSDQETRDRRQSKQKKIKKRLQKSRQGPSALARRKEKYHDDWEGTAGSNPDDPYVPLQFNTEE